MELIDLIGGYVGAFATTGLASLLGAYFGSYLKKKGENLATHEDINKLIEQVASVTAITKLIETQIANDVWQRQTARNDKKEVYVQVLGLLGQMRRAVDIAVATMSTGVELKLDFSKLDELREELYRIAPFAILVLGSSAATAIEAYRQMADQGSEVGSGTPDRWRFEGKAIEAALKALIEAGRIDLGLTGTSLLTPTS